MDRNHQCMRPRDPAVTSADRAVGLPNRLRRACGGGAASPREAVNQVRLIHTHSASLDGACEPLSLLISATEWGVKKQTAQPSV